MSLNKRERDQLVTCCTSRTSAFRSLGHNIDNPNGELIFVDNGADILAVGHLDNVPRAVCRPIVTQDKIVCGQLDDRLGVWGILKALPTMTDVPYDILLCDCEEIGQSTAEFFPAYAKSIGKDYRFAFELDREGTDCVTYQYDDAVGLEDSLWEEGWEIGYGSFSDISQLEDLGVGCVNLGIGYHDQHTKNCYAEFDEVVEQLFRVADWLENNSELWFPWTQPVYAPRERKVYGVGYDWKDDAKLYLPDFEEKDDTDTINMSREAFCEVCREYVDPRDVFPWNGRDICIYCGSQVTWESVWNADELTDAFDWTY